MSDKEVERRKEHAASEPFVISRTSDDFRVYSPSRRSEIYAVTGLPDSPECTCIDLGSNKNDPERRCKHILAVLNHVNQADKQSKDGDLKDARYEAEERRGMQEEAATGKELPNGKVFNLEVKRSISPDGRINSLSIRFGSEVEEDDDEGIRQRASRMLVLQDQIVEGFQALHDIKDKKQNGQRKSEPEPDGTLPGQMLDVGGTDTKWGRRLYINVDVGGDTLKLFGSKKQLAEHITAAGYPDLTAHLNEGVRLNLPCRVSTKPSDDGKYTNIDKVFPAEILKFTRTPAK